MQNTSFKDFLKERNQHIKRKEAEDVYSYIVVDKLKRTTLYFAVVIVFCFLNLYLFWEIFSGKNWLLMIPSTLLICSFLILVPISESWVYKPWQKSVQRCERMFLD